VLCCSKEEALQELSGMMGKWQKEGYRSESELFPLRCTLMLLCQNEIEAACSFVTTTMECYDGGSSLPPPGVQLAFFISEAAKMLNWQFYEMAKAKYRLVLRRDKSFDSLLEAIEKNVFGVSRNSGSAGGLLGLMGAMG